MRFTKMIWAMGLAFAFSASHAASNKIEFATKIGESTQKPQSECNIPKNLPKNYFLVECIGETGLLRFVDENQPTSGNVGIMDAQGKVLLPAEYYSITELPNSKKLFTVSRMSNMNWERALLDDKLQWVLPFETDQNFQEQENNPIIRVMRVQNGEPIYALFDTQTRQFITPFKYTFVREFSDDGIAGFSTAPLYKYGKYDENYPIGFLNDKGEEIIPEIYTQAGIFTEGVNWVEDKDGERWLIDKAGKKLWKIPYHYTVLSISNKGLINVENRFKEEAMIDHSGKEIVPFGKFDSFGHSDNLPVLFTQKGNQAGLLDLQGNELLPLGEYNRAEDASDEDENNKQSVVFVKDFQVSHYDEKGKLLKTTTSPYAKECAHVKLGAKHRHFPAYVVSNDSRAYRNHIEFAADGSDLTINGMCVDVAKPAAQKSNKSNKKRKK